MSWSPLGLVAPQLPEHCEPANEFLYHLSATFHTCVPTNLALVSTFLGSISIVAWLFAQLPQIYKNYTLKSTSGLSVFFLGEWLLGDVSNFLGCIFTDQALWQVIIGAYYCVVDFMLMGQWIWYEKLKHGRPMRLIWGRRWKEYQDRDDGMSDTASITSSEATITDHRYGGDQNKDGSEVPFSAIPRSSPQTFFRTPNFSRWAPGSVSPATPSSRTITRLGTSPLPSPSPRTVLYLTLLLSVMANASPVSTIPLEITEEPARQSATQIAGTLLSWMSTLLYLGSRLPQLYKNHQRRSTAGLSPTLFAAAFFGNLFYSTSLLTNPCAWYDFPAYDGHGPNPSRGWTGLDGNDRQEWIGRAAPFFLGAAGVLVMDAAVGFQFWWFGSHKIDSSKGAPTLVVALPAEDTGSTSSRRRKWRWRRVSGWMRGWVPSASESPTPRSQSPYPASSSREGRPLLVPSNASIDSRSYGGI